MSTTTTALRIQKWIWILIYLGIFLLALGIAVQRSDATLGWSMIVPACALIVAGIVLIWVRSRMKNLEK
ncbi:hypothetical protein [Pararhizobium sp.]|uniref:hypothetical protein n=1 Tax=Pararhizobium sp. TaxID=1977563 RepID=UPI0027219D09|nr:hypothetical protein [Pararhizobium sp.]MDO9415306.1 hypothetical protein [Pararhizobium sp.]